MEGALITRNVHDKFCVTTVKVYKKVSLLVSGGCTYDVIKLCVLCTHDAIFLRVTTHFDLVDRALQRGRKLVCLF